MKHGGSVEGGVASAKRRPRDVPWLLCQGSAVMIQRASQRRTPRQEVR